MAFLRHLPPPENGVSQRENPVPGRTIGEHGIVGNLDTAALVATDGTIDFMCWPHMDSPTVFAALLDPEAGGEFSVEPVLDDARTIQLYIPETNILMTRWMSEQGSVELTDFMPHPQADTRLPASLVRCLRVPRGAVGRAWTTRARCHRPSTTVTVSSFMTVRHRCGWVPAYR
jgi:hypothetical protein